MDPLERVIRPIVEGQIRSFTYDHPEVVDAVNWFKPRKDKRETFVNSLAKRVVRDLLCPMSRARLEAALVELAAASAVEGKPGTTDGLTEGADLKGSLGSHVNGPGMAIGSGGRSGFFTAPSPPSGGVL